MKLSEIKIGDTFKLGDYELIKFADNGEETIVVFKDTIYDAEFGRNNNFAESSILKRLNNEVLPKIEAIIGAENIKEFEIDLISLDGLDTHGKMKTRIGLPTFDFYRENVRLFDKHKLDEYWWLATPDTTKEHLNDNWAVCVSPYGDISGDFYYRNSGVRPFLHFVSSISLSCEE